MRDSYCTACGQRFADTATYPRRCTACGHEAWANPLTVAVVLVPVDHRGRRGVLVVRRAVPPGIGKLALISGFLEVHEPWQVGAAREVREETGAVLDPDRLEPLWFTSTSPRPHRVLLFSLAAPIDTAALAAHVDSEVLERGAVFGPDGLAEVFVYDHHITVVRSYFASLGITGAHDFTTL